MNPLPDQIWYNFYNFYSAQVNTLQTFCSLRVSETIFRAHSVAASFTGNAWRNGCLGSSSSSFGLLFALVQMVIIAQQPLDFCRGHRHTPHTERRFCDEQRPRLGQGGQRALRRCRVTKSSACPPPLSCFRQIYAKFPLASKQGLHIWGMWQFSDQVTSSVQSLQCFNFVRHQFCTNKLVIEGGQLPFSVPQMWEGRNKEMDRELAPSKICIFFIFSQPHLKIFQDISNSKKMQIRTLFDVSFLIRSNISNTTCLTKHLTLVRCFKLLGRSQLYICVYHKIICHVHFMKQYYQILSSYR